MQDDLYEYLCTVIERVRQDQFGQGEAPQLQMTSGTENVAGQGLRGSLEVTLRTADGTKAVLMSKSINGLKTRSEVDDAVAELLSTVLMNHSKWPR